MQKSCWTVAGFSLICLLFGYYLLFQTSPVYQFVEPTSKSTSQIDLNQGFINTSNHTAGIITVNGSQQNIGLKIKEIHEKAAVKRVIYNINISCEGKSTERVEDLLCMSPPKFLPEYKNPCWYSKNNRFNCLPYFHLIGGAKCASSDLFRRIVSHPDIFGNSGTLHKETMWWALRRYGFGTNGGQRRTVQTFTDYLKYFQKASVRIHDEPMRGYVTGDGSPVDLMVSIGWQLIQENIGLQEPKYITPHLIRYMNPNVKLMVILRDPVERSVIMGDTNSNIKSK